MSITTFHDILRAPHIVCVLSLVVCGCYKPRLISESPDKLHTIVVQQACKLSDCAIKVTIAGKNSERELAWRTGCDLLLASVVWSPDSDRAGVLVGNNYCDAIYLTYDLKKNIILSGAEMEAAQEDSLRRLFRFPSEKSSHKPGAMVKWALDSSLDAQWKLGMFRTANP